MTKLLLIKFYFIGFILKCAHSGETEACVLVEQPNAERLCIPLESINRAFTEARLAMHLIEPFPFPPYKAHHHHEEIDRLGLTLTETTRILAKQYQLNDHQIHYLIPKLDLALTDIWNFCPAQFKHKNCELTRYRSLSGHCNNLNHPDWGASFSSFSNVLAPERPDGVSAPKGYDEGHLPSARVVSALMHRDATVHDHAITIMLIAWGQIIDHDVTLTAETKDTTSGKDPNCCRYLGHPHYQGAIAPLAEPHHNCYPILIPPDDPFYSHYGQYCMNFLRSFAGLRANCRLGPRTAFNSISSFLDASFVYGSNTELAAELRSGKYGMLKSLPVFLDHGLKDLLPPKVHEPEDGCIRPNADVFCFLAGDIRVNEQLVLTVLHTMFMREHNRIAKTLGNLNPHWDDERIFQETRHIIIAMIQHITFEEFLPMILGKDLMHQYGLSLEKEGYWTGYDPKINPTATEEFITSAFRFGHSLLPSRIERWSHGHRYIDSEHLSKLIRQPYDVYRPGYVDTFIMGLVNQLAQAMDEGVTEQVTTLLFKEPQKHFGMDLAAMNIQRGRDHGVPGFTAYREICGLSPISHWDDLIGVMRNDTVYRYKQIYRSPHDIDLWSGGVSELSLGGSLLGPTFGCIIARQFQALRHGDRFWYELPELPSSFTPEQLHEIRKAKLSRMLCDNSDAVKTIQVYAMVYPDPHLNPRVPCEGLIIPRMNLEPWHEILPYPEPEYEHKYQHRPSHSHYDKNKHMHNHQSKIKQSNNKDIYTEDYQTLHPPEFDPSFLNSSSHYITTTTHSHSHDDYQPFHHDDTGYKAPHTHEYSEYDNIKGDLEHIYFSDPDPPIANNYGDIESSIPHRHTNQHNGDSNNGYTHSEYESTYPKGHRNKGPTVLVESIQAPTVPTPPIKIVVAKKAPRRPNRPNPIPQSPFPGLDGIFSPNPGYLVRQKFTIYKAPYPHPPQKSIMHSILG